MRWVPSPSLPALLVCVICGCEAQAAELRRVEADDELLSAAELTSDGHWFSAPWTNSRWIALPGRSTVEIAHGLGRAPVQVHVYLSFQEDDRESSSTRKAFAAAGDVAHLSTMDADVVAVENTTNGDFYLRVVLE